MIYAGSPSLFGLGLEDGHVQTFWLYCMGDPWRGGLIFSTSEAVAMTSRRNEWHLWG